MTLLYQQIQQMKADARDSLCWYDPRYTNYCPPMDVDARRRWGGDCSCDNCYYGRDALALHILALLEDNE